MEILLEKATYTGHVARKKVYQKIELTFNFNKEIHVKIIRNKKKSTLEFGLKNTL